MELLLGFDFGSSKIGIAIGQIITKQARALTTIKAYDGNPNWQELGQLIDLYKPSLLIVGLPLNMDDSDSEISLRAQKFARKLRAKFNIPVELWDERLTSFEARGILQENGKNPKSSKNKKHQTVDAVAAALILQSFLDNFQQL